MSPSNIDPFERGQLLVGRYLLKGRLDSGGMGEVHIARDQVLGRDVAIKRVKVDPDIPKEQLPMFMKRFSHEAKAVAHLRHPNIVSVHDVQQVNDTPFIVMEYFKGGVPLLKWGGQAKPTIGQWLGIAKALFSALHHAHSRGILHRDIKSGNVLARGSSDGDDVEVLLIDWGIALREGGTRLTQGGFIGTPGAIDPAVIKGGSWTQQSDFFALGALLYCCLCGRKPHDVPEDTPPLNLQAIYAENRIVWPHKVNPAIDGDLQTFLVRLLATDPAKRPPSARAAMAMIDALVEGVDVDFDGICAQYPSTPLLLDEDDVEEVDATDRDPPRQPGTLKLAGGQDDDSIARDLLGNAAAPPAKATKAEGVREAAKSQPSQLSGLSVAGDVPSEQAEAGNRTAGKNDTDARMATFRSDESPPPQQRSRSLRYVGLTIAAFALAALVYAKRQGPQQTSKADNAAVTIEPMDPSELQRKEKEPAALDKITAGSRAPSLDHFDPNTRAEYATNNATIGGTLPPAPAGIRERPSDGRPGKEPIKIDRSLRPAGLDSPAPKRAEILPIKYGTRVEVRLLETLDTSSGEQVKALLLHSLTVDQARVIPAGATFFGRASLRVTGSVVRSQAHFDRVLYPDGSEERIAAVSIKEDGSEGLLGGQFEYGDPDSDDTATKAGSVAKGALLDGVTALPGGAAMSGTLKSAVDETADAAGKTDQRPRRKNRMLVSKDSILKLQFQPVTAGR